MTMTLTLDAPLTDDEKQSVRSAIYWMRVESDLTIADELPLNRHRIGGSGEIITSPYPHDRRQYMVAVGERYWRFVQRAEVRRARNERRHMWRAQAWLDILGPAVRDDRPGDIIKALTDLGWGWGVGTNCWEDGYPTGELHPRPIGHVRRRSPYLHSDDNGGGEAEEWPVHECEAATPAAALYGAFAQAVKSWHDLGPAEDYCIRDLPGQIEGES